MKTIHHTCRFIRVNTLSFALFCIASVVVFITNCTATDSLKKIRWPYAYIFTWHVTQSIDACYPLFTKVSDQTQQINGWTLEETFNNSLYPGLVTFSFNEWIEGKVREKKQLRAKWNCAKITFHNFVGKFHGIKKNKEEMARSIFVIFYGSPEWVAHWLL